MMDKIHREATPKYYRITQNILEGIRRGEYLRHQKLPSIKQIMERYSTSSITAARVTRELVNKSAAYILNGKGCFVSSRREVEPAPRAAANNRIVCILNCGLNRFSMPVIKGILDETQPKGYELMILDSVGNRRVETAHLRNCLESGSPPAGIMFMPSHSSKKYKHVYYLEKCSVPVVVINRNMTREEDVYCQGNGAAKLLTRRMRVIHGGAVKKTVPGRNSFRRETEFKAENFIESFV